MLMSSITLLACVFYTMIFCSLTVEAKRKGACRKGRDAGRHSAEDLWEDQFDEDCNNIWDFSREAEKELIEDEFESDSSDNWHDEPYKRCARKAVRRVVINLESQCTSPGSGTCETVGMTAAEGLVGFFCREPCDNCLYQFGFEGSYLEACRDDGVIKCKEFIDDEVKARLENGFGCHAIDDDFDNFSITMKRDLQEDCEWAVDDMIE